MPTLSSSKAAPKSPRKSPARTPKKSPGRSPGRSARISKTGTPSSIHKTGTPTSALRLRKTASLALAFEEAELVAAEQQSAMEVDAAGARSAPNDGREAPKLVDFRSPPRAVFNNAAEARSARLKAIEPSPSGGSSKTNASKSPAAEARTARLKSRTTCLKLSDKGAFVHVERLGCHPPPRFQGYEATDNVFACQPVPMRSATPSPTPSVSPAGSANDPGIRPGLAAPAPAPAPAPRAVSGADHLRPLSRQSSLNSIAWGSISAGRSAVETPPSAPGAFEASELQGLCRAPLAQNRMTLVSRSCSRRPESRAGSTFTALSSVTAVTAVTAAAPSASPFPRPVAVAATAATAATVVATVAPFPCRPLAVAAVATARPFPCRPVAAPAVAAPSAFPRRPVAVAAVAPFQGVLAPCAFPRPVAVAAVAPFQGVIAPCAFPPSLPPPLSRATATAAPFPCRPVAIAAVATASPFPRRVPVVGEVAPLPPRAGGQGMMGSFVPINGDHSSSPAASRSSSD